MLLFFADQHKEPDNMADVMERMAANLLRGLGIDPDVIKKEFEGRVKQFEENIAKLNGHLLQINSRLANIEKHLGVTANDDNSAGRSGDNSGSEGTQSNANGSEPIATAVPSDGTSRYTGPPKLSAEYEGPAA